LTDIFFFHISPIDGVDIGAIAQEPTRSFAAKPPSRIPAAARRSRKRLSPERAPPSDLPAQRKQMPVRAEKRIFSKENVWARTSAEASRRELLKTAKNLKQLKRSLQVQEDAYMERVAREDIALTAATPAKVLTERALRMNELEEKALVDAKRKYVQSVRERQRTSTSLMPFKQAAGKSVKGAFVGPKDGPVPAKTSSFRPREANRLHAAYNEDGHKSIQFGWGATSDSNSSILEDLCHVALRRNDSPFGLKRRVKAKEFMNVCGLMLAHETEQGELAALATLFACDKDENYVDVSRFLYGILDKGRVASKWAAALKRVGERGPLGVFERHAAGSLGGLDFLEFRNALRHFGLSVRDWEAQALFDAFKNPLAQFLDPRDFVEEMNVLMQMELKRRNAANASRRKPLPVSLRPAWRGVKDHATVRDKTARFEPPRKDEASIFAWYESLDENVLPYLA